MRAEFHKMASCAAIALVCFLTGTAIASVVETAWIQFDPTWPSYAADSRYKSSGWSAIHGVAFDADDSGKINGVLTVARSINPGAANTAMALLNGRSFDAVRIDISVSQKGFEEGNLTARMMLEDVIITAYAIDAMAGATNLYERITLEFRAVTFQYFKQPVDGTTQMSFAEVDLATGEGRGALVEPRPPGTPPPLVATTRLRQVDGNPGAFRLGWESEPGEDYVVEFTVDLNEKFRPVTQARSLIGAEGRYTEIPLEGPIGFYRVIPK
jgi:type VI protein secretion system component Hcp